MKVRLKHRLEYALLRGIGACFCILPYRAALFIGWMLAVLAHYVVRYRVSEARRRIRQVLGSSVSEHEVRRIAWISMRNLSFNLVDILRTPVITERWIERNCDCEALHALRKRLHPGQGAILAVAHTGNWDLAGIAVRLLGLPIFFMARRQKNPLVDAHLNRMRGTSGGETIRSDTRAVRPIIHMLKGGHVFAILPDVRARSGGIPIPFFGGHAWVAPGAAFFARRADVPIIPVAPMRIGWTRHRWRVYEPIAVHPDTETQTERERVMREIMATLDRAVREHPEQYFWYNKRWILDPPRHARTDHAPDT